MPPYLSAFRHLPYGAHIRSGILFCSLLLLSFLLTGKSAFGAEPPRRVAISQDLQVFYPAEKEGTFSREALQEILKQTVHRQWRLQPVEVELLPGAMLQSQVMSASLYEGTLALARQWGEMGVTAYKEVQTQNAVNYLERAIQNFSAISHEFVAPEELAEVLMFLALSYLEDGTDVVRPLELLQEMIRRDPELRILPGFYPDFIVRYYQSALDTLYRELRTEGPPSSETRRVAEIVDADFVFHSYVLVNGDGTADVVAYLFDRQEDQFRPGERIHLPEVTEENLTEAISRLVSRLSACLIDVEEELSSPPAIMSSQGTGRLSVQLTLNYGSFLQSPTPVQNPFGNYGVGIGAGWSITQEFQLVGGLQVFNSLRDYQGILRDDFTTLRTYFGGELGRYWGPMLFGLAAGAEMASFGPIRVFTDPACIPAPEILCPGDAGTLLYENRPPHLGVFIRPRVALSLGPALELSSTVSFGYYFSPLAERIMNFPLTTEMGVRYRF